MTLKDFLLARLEEEEANTREWPAHLAAPALRELKAKLSIIEHWPDPTGQWTAEQADAAHQVKIHAMRALASVYADRPDYETITDLHD